MQAGTFAILLYFVFFHLVQAEEIGTASVNVLPAGGKHRGVVLKSQTVDVVVNTQQGKIWADTAVWLRLHNPASKVITVSVTLPGPQTSPVGLPPDLQAWVGKKPLNLSPSKATESEGESASGQIGIPARSSVDVRLTYRQALPERGGRTVYAYMLSGADQWAGTPESLRVTVEFKPPMSPDQLLFTIAPDAHRTDAHSLTWDWEGEWAKTRPSISLAFMTPTWWDEYTAARAAAERDGAGTDEHLALAQHYRRLASLPSLPFEAEGAYHTRYYPSVIAELQTTIATSTSLSDTLRARVLLADLYREEADRAAPEAVVYYLQSAAEEIHSATQGDTPSPELTALAKDVYAKLTQQALEGGDEAAAREYRQRSSNLQGSPALDKREARQFSQPVAAAVRAVENGDEETARQLLAEAFRTTPGMLPKATHPVANHSVITVTSTPDRRVIGLTLEGGHNVEAVNRLIQQTAAAIGARVPVEISTDSNHLTLTLPFGQGPELAEMQRDLASSVPPAPELALLGGVLASAPMVSEIAISPISATWRFEERLDLTGAAVQWYQLADRLDASSTAPTTSEPPPVESQGLNQLQRALGTADAEAWREMARNSRVEYLVDVDDPLVSRTWQIPAGASHDILINVGRWNLEHLRWALLVATILVISGAALVWRLG